MLSTSKKSNVVTFLVLAVLAGAVILEGGLICYLFQKMNHLEAKISDKAQVSSPSPRVGPGEEVEKQIKRGKRQDSCTTGSPGPTGPPGPPGTPGTKGM